MGRQANLCEQKMKYCANGGNILHNTIHGTCMTLELLSSVCLIAACRYVTGHANVPFTRLVYTLRAVVAVPLFFLFLLPVVLVTILRSGIDGVNTELD